MATCVYVVSQDSSHLLMAKSKLSPIRTKTTTPKLEMNALTISARLALSVLNALSSEKQAMNKGHGRSIGLRGGSAFNCRGLQPRGITQM
ncbi:hypothetical protein ANCDUO_00469 [Ancylostoma duodenale]|uniref:Uncharacterized protein n=1 Tax=Ancylostoma duodenale TaxID=51022 RepID=A0A0C2H5Q1_9BILA|nr:hypothetical protein ANCDUO_00469 [Ancylostoma duodenale]